MNTLLYLLTWISWGGSWLAIKWQHGPVPIHQSILYRFALAAVIIMLFLLLVRKLQRTGWRDHLFFLLQGGSLFSLNFIAFYSATGYISS
ncbi:MAG: EamA family transporter, partial [Chromatiales bacterium]|nr:EamA family transporter [Chromatiales bacterium]